MEEIFDYNQVPHDFVHCFNAQCPRAGECLRQFVARHVTADVPRLHVVNPLAYPQEGSVCGQFQPMVPIRVGWGLRNALDRLPHKEAEAMSKRLHRLYSRITLYRIMHHERPILPEEQGPIVKAFKALGVPYEQVFDRIQVRYDWNARP